MLSFACFAIFIQRIPGGLATSMFKSGFKCFGDSTFIVLSEPEAILYDFDRIFLLPVNSRVALPLQPGFHLFSGKAFWYRYREGHHAALGFAFYAGELCDCNLIWCFSYHVPATVGTVQVGGSGEQQFQMIVQLGHCADG